MKFIGFFLSTFLDWTMKSFVISFCVIVYLANFCVSKPAGVLNLFSKPPEPAQKKTISDTSKLMSAAASKLGNSECGSSHDLPCDLRTVLVEVLGLSLADIIAGVDATLETVKGFFNGYRRSHKDLGHKVSCGLYYMASDAHDLNDREFVNKLKAFMTAGN